MKGKSVAMFMEHEDTKLFDKSLVTGIHHQSTECCGTSGILCRQTYMVHHISWLSVLLRITKCKQPLLTSRSHLLMCHSLKVHDYLMVESKVSSCGGGLNWERVSSH